MDQPTAEAIANDVRGLGLKATVVDEGRVAGTPDWVLANWWVAIPVRWILYPALMIQGAPEWTALVLAAATVMLATLAAPLAGRRAVVRRLPDLPVAWTADLRPMLAEEWRARALLPADAAAAMPSTRWSAIGWPPPSTPTSPRCRPKESWRAAPTPTSPACSRLRRPRAGCGRSSSAVGPAARRISTTPVTKRSLPRRPP